MKDYNTLKCIQYRRCIGNNLICFNARVAMSPVFQSPFSYPRRCPSRKRGLKNGDCLNNVANGDNALK